MISGLVNSIKNSANNVYKEAVEKFKQPPTTQQFKINGMLSPTQFQKAGDKLVDNGGWKWKQSLNPNYKTKYLPSNKQFLMIENIKCQKRLSDIIGQGNFNEIETEEGVIIMEQKKTQIKEENYNKKLRLYTMYITYDQFYYTPRMYFSAKDTEDEEIQYNDLLQDVVQQYRGATLTSQEFKFIQGRRLASVHPCKHAQVLKSMTQTMEEGNLKVDSHFALFIFLKFISSVIPTVDYDLAGQLWFA